MNRRGGYHVAKTTPRLVNTYLVSHYSSIMSPSTYSMLDSLRRAYNVPDDSRVAADTGVHIGDGHLFIRQNGADTNYVYDVTGNAIDDQLYLLGHVIPTIEAAYDIHKFGVRLAPEATWLSIVYQSKEMALFKHRVLELPNGRKTDLSIPQSHPRRPRSYESLYKRNPCHRWRARILQRLKECGSQISSDPNHNDCMAGN